MTRRPDPFDQSALEAALRDLGCPESVIPATISNYRLFVPLLFACLGEEGVFDVVSQARAELGLGEQHAAWRSSIKNLVAWAHGELDNYKTRRGLELAADLADALDDCQPRLF